MHYNHNLNHSDPESYAQMSKPWTVCSCMVDIFVLSLSISHASGQETLLLHQTGCISIHTHVLISPVVLGAISTTQYAMLMLSLSFTPSRLHSTRCLHICVRVTVWCSYWMCICVSMYVFISSLYKNESLHLCESHACAVYKA